jgi:hypothetical protein
LAAIAALTSGCAALGGAAAGQFADGLATAILDADDPALVRDGTPAYLLLLDALISSDPGNARYLSAAGQLYAAYGLMFVTDTARTGAMTIRARDYGSRAICSAHHPACGLDELEFDRYSGVVTGVRNADAEALYSYCVGTLAYVRAHSGEWTAIALLPRVELALRHLESLDTGDRAASVNTYLGILNTLRPEALGGRPEEGRRYFETAIRLSGGRDLSAKVEYARGYARLVYDRDLHDRLLNEVLESPARAPGLTLFNTLAQQQARELLASADDYF